MKGRTDGYRSEWMYEDYKTERMSSCGGTTGAIADATTRKQSNERMNGNETNKVNEEKEEMETSDVRKLGNDTQDTACPAHDTWHTTPHARRLP